jgi:hypothetical protein
MVGAAVANYAASASAILRPVHKRASNRTGHYPEAPQAGRAWPLLACEEVRL